MSEDDIRKMMHSSNQLTLNLQSGKEVNTHALDDVLQFIAGNTHMHMKTSMKTVKDRFMKAPYGFVEDDVQWLIARLFKRGDLAFTVNGASVTMMNKGEEEIINLIIKKAFVEKLLMEQRIRVSNKDKKSVRDVMKELFRTSSISDEEDTMMTNFITYSRNVLGDLGKMEIRYETTPYPGRKVIQNGKKLLGEVVQVQSPIEFFQIVSKKKDDLIDFAFDFEPVKAFFDGEQKTIFDKALHDMGIYNDSKTYIVDADVEASVASILEILHKSEPYKDILKLPELLDTFWNAYMKVLDAQEEPVLASIDESRSRVLEVLNTKEYKDTIAEKYRVLFEEIWEGARHCNNVSTLRSFSDRGDALKLRLLNEMDKMDAAIAKQKAEDERRRLEEEAKKNGQNPDNVVAQPKPEYKVKKSKNVAIKTVTRTSSWRLESESDVDKYLSALRERLIQELDQDMIVNIEF
jgi:hypothetical protein